MDLLEGEQDLMLEEDGDGEEVGCRGGGVGVLEVSPLREVEEEDCE